MSTPATPSPPDPATEVRFCCHVGSGVPASDVDCRQPATIRIHVTHPGDTGIDLPYCPVHALDALTGSCEALVDGTALAVEAAWL